MRSHDGATRMLDTGVAFREMISFAPPARLILLLQSIRHL
jgi:hypothetical protein